MTSISISRFLIRHISPFIFALVCTHPFSGPIGGILQSTLAEAFTFLRIVSSINYSFPTPTSSVVYLLNRGRLQAVPDEQTVISFGFDPANLTTILLPPNELIERIVEASLRTGLQNSSNPSGVEHLYPIVLIPGNISSVVLRDKNSPDERMRVFTLKAQILQGRELVYRERSHDLGHFLNPSITVWKTVGDGPGQREEQGQSRPGTLRGNIQRQCLFVSTKTPAAPPLREYFFLTLLTGNCSTIADDNATFRGHTNLQLRSFPMRGEDPRILPLSDDRQLLVFTHSYSRGGCPHLGVSLLSLNRSTGSPQFSPARQLETDKGPCHKNWTPFVYNGTAMFIMHLNPMHVVTIADNTLNANADNAGKGTEDGSSGSVPGEGVSRVVTVSSMEGREQGLVQLTWNGGHLRGGTPAHRINQREYLTIFHSTKVLPGSRLITFFSGAMTFSSHPPFRIIRVSTAPIIYGPWYDGPWFRRKYDYIVYPMGFIFASPTISSTSLGNATNSQSSTMDYTYSNDLSELIDLDEGFPCERAENVSLVVSYGRQDMDAWLSRIKLCDLLDTMEFV